MAADLIAQRAVRRATLDALNGWVLDVVVVIVVVSIAVMCPTVSCYVLNIKEQAAALQFNLQGSFNNKEACPSFPYFLTKLKKKGRGSGRGGTPSPSCRGRTGIKPSVFNPSF